MQKVLLLAASRKESVLVDLVALPVHGRLLTKRLGVKWLRFVVSGGSRAQPTTGSSRLQLSRSDKEWHAPSVRVRVQGARGGARKKGERLERLERLTPVGNQRHCP